MKIQAFMPVRNEADVIVCILRDLCSQGIAVHCLDGWSTDATWAMIAFTNGLENALESDILNGEITAERFPRFQDDGVWNCHRMLKYIEDLAERSDADWCMLTDADEWRRSPKQGEKLCDAINRVEQSGYNAIDHRVYAFWPTDDGWPDAYVSPEHYFRYYSEDDMICRLPQIKIWKNIGRVDLVSSGGHEAKFRGRKVYPEKFIMKHYPFRTSAQARARIQDRLKRRCAEEHAMGWGVHYDQYAADDPYLWDARTLKEWRNPWSPTP